MDAKADGNFKVFQGRRLCAEVGDRGTAESIVQRGQGDTVLADGQDGYWSMILPRLTSVDSRR